MTGLALSAEDRRELAERGISEAEVARQLRLFREPPTPVPLVRPATVGDGIVRLDAARHDDLLARATDAVRRGRASRFVPASGAATRMFRSLLQARHPETGDGDADAAGRRFLAEVERFPFFEELEEEMGRADLAAARRDGDPTPVLAALLDADRLAYDTRPKGLIPFHRYADGTLSTAFAEHLAEGAAQVADADGRCRLHFTVAPEHRALFTAALEAARRVFAAAGRGLDVSFSEQSPSTDTVAGDPAGGLFHAGGHAGGRLVFRPGGHGALIANLGEVAELGGDLVTIKNIDNVLPAGDQPLVVRWKQLLTGHLLALEERLVDYLERLETGAEPGPWLDEGLRFATTELSSPLVSGSSLPGDGAQGDAEAKRRLLRRALDRPLRVCGVVVNTGEPGGGPFWVAPPRGSDRGPSLQIVETSQIDRQDPAQEAILQAATHFNPVDVVARLRDHRGRPYELTDPELVDETASFVARKSHEGEPILALERPGLWNGAMAGWNTVFVEVPGATFAPVKTVFDLLRDEHQASDQMPGDQVPHDAVRDAG